MDNGYGWEMRLLSGLPSPGQRTLQERNRPQYPSPPPFHIEGFLMQRDLLWQREWNPEHLSQDIPSHSSRRSRPFRIIELSHPLQFSSKLDFRIPLASTFRAPVGQTWRQDPQPTQFSVFLACLPSSSMPLYQHTSSHLPQPMHLSWSTARIL